MNIFSVPIKINLSLIQQIPNTYHMSSTLLGVGDIALKKKEVKLLVLMEPIV